MPRTLKKTDIREVNPEMGTVVPFSPSGVERASPDEWSATPVCEQTFGNRADAAKGRGGASLRASRLWVAARYRTLKRQSAESYNHISLRCRRFVSDARDRSSRARNEQPLPLLGGIAGAAFIAGIVIRVWRSSRHA